MARKKVKLARILNDNARKASLKKRRLGLMKKMEELAILCDVEAFLIMYSPGEIEPLLWPHHDAVQTLFAKFLSIPEIERSRKHLNQEYYLRERKGKMHHQLHKYSRIIKEMAATHLMNQIYLEGKKIDELNTSGFDSLNSFIEGKRKEFQRVIRHYRQMSLNQLVPEQVIPTVSIEQQMPGIESNDDAYPWGQLIMEMMNQNEHIPENNTANGAILNIYQDNNTTIATSTNNLSLQNLIGNHIYNFSLNSRLGGNIEHGTMLPQEYFQSANGGFNQLLHGHSSNGGGESHNMWMQQENVRHAMVHPSVAVENNNEGYSFSLPQESLLNNSVGTSLRGPYGNHMSSFNEGNEVELPPLPTQLQFPNNWPNDNLYFQF